MSKNDVWAILHVDEEARNEAKKRAKLEGKAIGKWISDLILGKGSSPSNPTNMSTEMNEIKSGIKVIYNEVDKLNDSLSDIQEALTNLSENKDSPRKNKFFGKFL